MTRNKFITYVHTIKRMVRTIENYYWTARNLPDALSYGSFYEVSIDILSEVFPKGSHRKILVDMFKTYRRDIKFTKEYNVNGKLVRTPIELYDAIEKGNNIKL